MYCSTNRTVCPIMANKMWLHLGVVGRETDLKTVEREGSVTAMHMRVDHPINETISCVNAPRRCWSRALTAIQLEDGRV